MAAGRFDEIDALARRMTSRQLAELEAYERAEGYSIGARGDWERAAYTRAGAEPRGFIRWAEQKLRSFGEFMRENPQFFRAGGPGKGKRKKG